MPLEPQEIEIPLNLGMATKPSAELQDPSAMRLVQNLHWRGQGEIEKRPVYGVSTAIAAASGSDYTEAQASSGLIVRENDICAISASHGVMTYSPQLGSFRYTRSDTQIANTPNTALKFRPASYDVSRRQVHSAQFNKSSEGVRVCAGAQYSGLQVIAWIEVANANTKLRAKAIDPFTGTELASSEFLIISGTTMALDACQYTEVGKQGVVIGYVAGSAAPYTVGLVRYDAASNEFVTDTNLTTNAKTGAFTFKSNGTNFYFGFTDNTSGFLTVQKRQVGGVTVSTHTATHGGDGGVSIATGTSQTLIASCTSTTVYAERFGSAASAITAITAVNETFIGGISCAFETRASGSNTGVIWVNAVTSGASGPSGWRVRCTTVNIDAATPILDGSSNLPHCKIIAGGFTLLGHAHVPLTIGLFGSTSANQTCFVARHFAKTSGGQRHDCVARIMHDTFFEPPVTVFDSMRNGVQVDSDGNAWVVLPGDMGAETINSNILPQSVYLCRLNGARPMPMAYAAPQRDVVMVAGGLLWEFDGETASEAAPLIKPMVVTDVSSTGVTGTYGAIAVYTWVDAAGRLHRMASDPVLQELTNDKLDVYVSTCPMRTYDATFMDADMEPELYVTGSGGTTGSVYFLASTSGTSKLEYSSATADGLWYKFTAYNPSGNSSIELDISDAGGAIAPEPPPAFSYVAKVVDRMVAINAEDRTEVWYSKPIVDGYAVEWATVNKFRIEDECVGIVDMGLGICVLARGGIYLVDGEGPDATGLGGFSPARKLNHAVDCIDPASICRTPLGVIFRGRRGFYVLGNDMAAQPFSVPVDPEVLTDPALDPSASTTYRMRTVYQEQTNELSICGIPGYDRLVYNLLEQKWSKYDTAAVEIHDMAVARGKLWLIARSGSVDYLRDELLFSSSGASYNSDTFTTTEIDTPWYKLDEVAGQVRLWRVWFAFKLPSDVADVTTISIAYYTDNEDTVRQTVTWTGAELNTAYSTTEQVARLAFFPSIQVVHSFRFTITCSFSSATSGPKPLSMRLRFGVRPSKSKRNKLQSKG